ncbi:MAG: NlpC/P60 family protein [Candidatus Zixiibacteriota bacterium]
MKYGIVIVPVVDLRKRGWFSSERASQALFGTPVQIHSSRLNYIRITLPEGYSGWVNQRHIVQVSHAKWNNYIDLPKERVRKSILKIRFGNKPVEPHRLFFGTEVAVSHKKNGAVFYHPQGLYLPIQDHALIPRTMEPTAAAIVKTATRFVGVPYLWGGITPCGFDCSGLVQAVYRMHGIELPRDSKQQAKVGEKIERDKLEKGDLLFFKGHVAICGDEGTIVHATSSRGMTVIESLDKNHPNYRKDLDTGFLFGRRVL